MTLTQRAATGRFYDLGGASEEPVDSALWLAKANRDGSLAWTAVNPYYYYLDPTQPAPFGLLHAVGPGLSGAQHFSGIQVDGDGDDIRIDVRLNCGGINFPFGVNHILFRLLQNDTVIYSDNVAQTATHIFEVLGFQTQTILTGITVAAGDIFRTDFQYERNSSFNVFGNAQGGPYLRVFGTLTPPGVIPGQPPMRLHGAVGAEL